MSSESTGRKPARILEAWTRLMERWRTQPGAERIAETAIAGAPVVWLVGKVQAGKSSIIQALTGCDEAEIGNGFKACTRTARVFDFPAEAPVIRFLDTRGLGEAGYDPEADLAVAEAGSHLLLVVMRAMDPQQDKVIEAISEVRKRRPSWPVVVAHTSIHDAYAPGKGHPLPYPFSNGEAVSIAMPELLVRSLAHQRRLFEALSGNGPIHFVPIDFTHVEDGYAPRHYGLDALVQAISEAAPVAVSATLREIRAGASDRYTRQARPVVLGYAGAAAVADAVPVAGAIAVPGIQAKMLHALAAHYGLDWDRRALAEFGGCLGVGIVARFAAQFGIRELVKLVPGYGQTVGAAAAAASSFATTYALGSAALVFLRRRREGEHDPEAVAEAYRQSLARAFQLARDRGVASGDSGEGPKS